MTRVYLDSSALIKRIFDERESLALRDALTDAEQQGVHLVTSALARVEVGRVARTRIDADLPRVVGMAATEAMDGISTAHLTRTVMDSARIIGPPVLRTLDAIHLATAVALSVDEIWTYDIRMAQVAEELGIPAVMPGRDSIDG
ncbi:type II toxin-antitoxin system VapC family toxin [Microbacterium alcoholitolerans]|uniref:type II toxin-antitoxin system VapC family toxin n=1 Tax=unclassified Microbacterium TaxID=2609290 RepID=UPI003D173BBB